MVHRKVQNEVGGLDGDSKHEHPHVEEVDFAHCSFRVVDCVHQTQPTRDKDEGCSGSGEERPVVKEEEELLRVVQTEVHEVNDSARESATIDRKQPLDDGLRIGQVPNDFFNAQGQTTNVDD
eukprot:CAMPEP_0204912716 /NCGR_PEP_ID=MMETSP1397-20131031/10827_1 /ASSEMBLY_ACC=CAM_ASM_000891 /TAXON_ID=49980 /ORGANISM="Climacostomum Climacostomum virens, Strain Stock W-24" /LENGTH=121 /DNA_ID=CAMNT_0052083785 /DNA_START=362 /DNA_END=727 /DNA_ORIENTATION=-